MHSIATLVKLAGITETSIVRLTFRNIKTYPIYVSDAYDISTWYLESKDNYKLLFFNIISNSSIIIYRKNIVDVVKLPTVKSWGYNIIVCKYKRVKSDTEGVDV